RPTLPQLLLCSGYLNRRQSDKNDSMFTVLVRDCRMQPARCLTVGYDRTPKMQHSMNPMAYRIQHRRHA
ncbi:hypothetical protein PQQ51_34345, partial [Paraburkholderia xenovorans]|uniref:hypothetical protein n=1 Tax=Paraburkholderia xenovorans TaxID=36873 RepID=UPI0038BB1FAE